MLTEWREAQAQLRDAEGMAGGAAARLEATEARLFALRAAARKHQVDPDQLAALHQRLAGDLAALDDGAARLASAQAEEGAALATYGEAATALSRIRKAGAARLAAAVRRELAPLKLEAARFAVGLSARAGGEPSAQGEDEIAFLFASSPEAELAPMGRTASGGEMARLSLAIAVSAAGGAGAGTLMFDEADIGLGGAVAAAVGERLARLGRTRQVVAVTHSPQVAALAGRQVKVEKAARGGRTRTRAEPLAPEARREEIARMLAGARVTEEARAAADRLLAGG
jgi:DNA repair protein RecN (Recombination protein N)